MSTAPEDDGKRIDLELLRYQSDDGVQLNALYFTPDARTRSMVMLVPGLNGPVMGGRHDYRPLARDLTDRGYALMLPHMRSANDFAHARFDDSAVDIRATMREAKARGIEDIALIGTSMGGCRVAHFMATEPEPAVRVMIFLAAITSSYYEARYRFTPERLAQLEALQQRCRDLVAAGNGLEPVCFRDWFPGRHQTLSAASFLSYFGDPARDTNAATVKWTGRITPPTLVIHGTADESALPPNAHDIYDGLVNAASRELRWIEGATHYLQPGWIAETYARTIAAWVADNMPATRA